MFDFTPRIDSLREGLREGSIGCPAARSLFTPQARVDPAESVMIVGIEGNREEQEGRIYDALMSFWREQNASVLILVPPHDPVDFIASSEVFREVFFSLSTASHSLFQDTLDTSDPWETDPLSLEHYEMAERIHFDLDQLRNLLGEYPEIVWESVAEFEVSKKDLLAPFPSASPSWANDNACFVLALSPHYPQYPEHRRHSPVSALVINKQGDLTKFTRRNGNDPLRTANREWAGGPGGSYPQSVLPSYPALSPEESFVPYQKYVQLREVLARKGECKPFSISAFRTAANLLQSIGVSQDLGFLVMERYELTEIAVAVSTCKRDGLSGDEAFMRVLRESLS